MRGISPRSCIILRTLTLINTIVTRMFPLWILAFSILAFYRPGTLGSQTGYIPTLLGIIMFGMGTTLTAADFRLVLTRPLDIAIGSGTQFLVMPALGYAIAKLLALEPLLAAGMVLLGSCPGGTASNVITYLARGNVAFSVTLTAVSTLAAPLMTPLLTYLYADQWMNIPVEKLFVSTMKIVLVPVVLGIGVRWALRERIGPVVAVMPAFSALVIIYVVGIIVAVNSGAIVKVGALTALAVVLHNGLGLIIGYRVALLSGMDQAKSRALAIEVGMQNSGLGVALASAYLGVLAALPGALFSIWHNIIGSLLALLWRNKGDTPAR